MDDATDGEPESFRLCAEDALEEPRRVFLSDACEPRLNRVLW